MYTANDARNADNDDLDQRIEYAVKHFREGNGASLRIYHDDSFRYRIVEELEMRGFKNIHAPSFTVKTDVYFEWD